MDWRAASAQFERCLTIAPGDAPSKIYRERVAMLEAHPPEAGWDGVWRLTAK